MLPPLCMIVSYLLGFTKLYPIFKVYSITTLSLFYLGYIMC